MDEPQKSAPKQPVCEAGHVVLVGRKLIVEEVHRLTAVGVILPRKYPSSSSNRIHYAEKAKMYMDMWYYAQEGEDYTKGPVGDAGLVELDDFLIWVDNYGTTSAEWTWTPGNDIDPDFDNTDYVDGEDFLRWAENFGREYPFPGAW